MMRTTLLAAVIALCCYFSASSDAQPGAPNAAGKPAGFVGWPREVKGYGKTVEEAEKDAYKNVVDRVTACLKQQDPPLEAWQPKEEYAKKNLVDGPGDEGDEVAAGGIKAKTWILTLKDAPDWTEMVRFNQAEVRKEVSKDRRVLTGYILAALTALLTLGWGYLRLDGWTNGRLTRWACIAAAVIVALAGLGWLTSN